MTKPDPEFMAFFAGEWKRLTESVKVPGLPHASWDRKAAYLLWVLGQQYDGGMPENWQDALRGALAVDNTRLTQCTTCGVIGGHASGCPEQSEAEYQAEVAAESERIHRLELEALQDNAAAALWALPDGEPFINPASDDDCAPWPGGVNLVFDSAKW